MQVADPVQLEWDDYAVYAVREAIWEMSTYSLSGNANYTQSSQLSDQATV